MQKTLGGDRLGSGNKLKVELHNYGYSNHNLGRAWRSTMSPGTLVPFFVEPALNGDQFDIECNALVRTHPTIGPMFGSFRLQMDFFVCPMRLYNKQLHNNKLNIGLKMENVIFPIIEIEGISERKWWNNPNLAQINPSSILSYLGIRGLGKSNNISTTPNAPVTRIFDAQPFLAYWDIYKNYYANKQETNAYVMSAGINQNTSYITNVVSNPSILWIEGQQGFQSLQDLPDTSEITITGLNLQYGSGNVLVSIVRRNNLSPSNQIYLEERTPLNQSKWFNITSNTATSITVTYNKDENLPSHTYIIVITGNVSVISAMGNPSMATFPLTNIDDMREAILSAPSEIPFKISKESSIPYSTPLSHITTGIARSVADLCGLGIKTYQSDRFNNWLSTEWIDGLGGISQITSIDTSSGSFTMDALNLAQKVYNMLNRIAVSGGSYVDWQEAVYGETIHPMPETPWFAGGSSQEITFNEVTSTSETSEDMPLGTLAGKGYSMKENNKIHIKILEPSFIMGIISITPRIDYSQGNKWFTRLKTMDDLHKPALDGIGFQQLITEELAAWDTIVNNNDPTNLTFKSAGKQPSWIHYMTSVNEIYGNFAMPDQEMYMTLNRNYSPTYDNNMNIRDLTTYIDPQKFNANFARTDLAAQNFWVQLGIDVFARRKMSAKQIPTL